MRLIALLMIALTNTTVVIDINGNVRELLPGETAGPGEVVVVVGRGATAISDFGIEMHDRKGAKRSIEIDDDIASVYDMLDNGDDPTSESEYATSAGDGATSHIDELQSQGLTEPQSESLINYLNQHVEPSEQSTGSD